MKPGAGAFTVGNHPTQQGGPAMPPRPSVPGPQDVAGPAPSYVPQGVPQGVTQGGTPDDFLEQLKGLGLLGSMPQGVPQAMPATPGGGITDPAAMLSKAPEPTRPVKKGRFTPGKPGDPRSGMSAHQIMRDPSMLRTLHEKISAWEAENPNRSLMGSHIQSMLPVSPAQARTIKRMLVSARAKHQVSDMDGLLQQGAASALKRER